MKTAPNTRRLFAAIRTFLFGRKEKKTSFDPQIYQRIIEDIIRDDPTRYRYFVTGPVSQEWAFDFLHAHTVKNDSPEMPIQHEIADEMIAIFEKLRVLGFPPVDKTKGSSAGTDEFWSKRSRAAKTMADVERMFVFEETDEFGSNLSRCALTMRLWSYYAKPLRWTGGTYCYGSHQGPPGPWEWRILRWTGGTYYYARATGDKLDPVIVMKIDPEQLPVVVSLRMTEVGQDVVRMASEHKCEMRRQKGVFAVVLAYLVLVYFCSR